MRRTWANGSTLGCDGARLRLQFCGTKKPPRVNCTLSPPERRCFFGEKANFRALKAKRGVDIGPWRGKVFKMNWTRLPIALTAFVAAISSCWAQVFEVEPNNILAQANQLSNGVAIRGQFASSSDVDWFAITVPASGGLTISFNKQFPADITVQNSSGTIIASYSNAFSPFVRTVGAPTAGTYYIKVDRSYSTDDYSISATYVPLGPEIQEQPASQNATAGSTATLSVTANGIPPLSYQWLKDNAAVSGGTGGKLIFPSVSASDAGNYSVIIRNATGSVTSVAATLTVIPLPNPPRLINLSVLTMILNNGTLTTGFVVGGSTSKRVIVRAVGPSLVAFGVTGTMPDPRLTLFNQQGVAIAANDNWAPTDAITMASAGAFSLPSFSRDAVTVATLVPGNYTVVVTGVGGVSGMALVEVFEVP